MMLLEIIWREELTVSGKVLQYLIIGSISDYNLQVQNIYSNDKCCSINFLKTDLKTTAHTGSTKNHRTTKFGIFTLS